MVVIGLPGTRRGPGRRLPGGGSRPWKPGLRGATACAPGPAVRQVQPRELQGDHLPGEGQKALAASPPVCAPLPEPWPAGPFGGRPAFTESAGLTPLPIPRYKRTTTRLPRTRPTRDAPPETADGSSP